MSLTEDEFIQYAYKKIQEDYQLVSLDYTVGSVFTNIFLALNVFIRRFYTHLIKHGYTFNASQFIKEYPLKNNN